jgi:acetyltransferase-like isoleucine patch superfamily enzyme
MKKWLQRIRLRKSCVFEPTTVFHDTARVFNHRRVREAIKLGKSTHVRGELLTFGHGGEISLGDFCYVGEGTRVWSAKRVSIGHRVLIAHNVTILDSLTHPLDAVQRHQHFRQIISAGHPVNVDLDEREVAIADDAWIGCAVVILRGVSVGEGSIVGAGSVVMEDVPAWTLVAGNPARIVRHLKSDQADA